MRFAISVARPNLISVGTCLGKFSSKAGVFKLHVTALDVLAQYAKFKVWHLAHRMYSVKLLFRKQVWVKPNGEMPFLYGNHVVKTHLGRITEDTPEHQGVVIYSMNDVPLVSSGTPVLPGHQPQVQGFGVTARSTVDTRKLDPTAIIVFHQA